MDPHTYAPTAPLFTLHVGFSFSIKHHSLPDLTPTLTQPLRTHWHSPSPYHKPYAHWHSPCHKPYTLALTFTLTLARTLVLTLTFTLIVTLIVTLTVPLTLAFEAGAGFVLYIFYRDRRFCATIGQGLCVVCVRWREMGACVHAQVNGGDGCTRMSVRFARVDGRMYTYMCAHVCPYGCARVYICEYLVCICFLLCVTMSL